MQLKPEEISKVIRSQIKYYQNAIEQSETGTVLIVGDGIARVSGLTNCMSGELLEFEDGTFGMAQNLEENSVSVVLFGSDQGISEGQTVKRTGKVVSVPVGEAMIGRVVNAIGQPIDGAGPIETTEYRPVESPAPGICDRQPVKEPLQTGIKAIDSMIPIGRGQRELIIGDRQTGKTTIATDTRRAKMLSVSMLPSDRNVLPLPAWYLSCRQAVLWIIPLLLLQLHLRQAHYSTLHLIQAVQWVNIL